MTTTFVNDEVLQKQKKEYEKARELEKAVSPKETPYKTKYEAREKLKNIINQLDSEQDHGDHCRSLIGGLYCAVGIIDIDVEELSEGDVNLNKSIEILDSIDNAGFSIVPKIRALNQLGILWSLREDHEKAGQFLEKSLAKYHDFKKDVDSTSSHLYDLEELFSASKDVPAPTFEEKESVLELLNTHTHYYLAQVYERTGEAARSAECCLITLTKQLGLKEYQPLDWSTNAAMLSQHYLAKENYAASKKLLMAAMFVLNRYKSELDSQEVVEEANGEAGSLEDDRDEIYRKCKSDIGRAWGKYCLLLMQRSQDKDVEAKTGSVNPELTVEDIENKPSEAASQGDLFDFPSIEPDPTLSEIPETYATNFEEARSMFLPAQRLLNAAKTDYYKFEEHCVDYVEIQRDLSHMHKVLIYFEPDNDRQYKMHKRRIDILHPLYQELNVQIYTLLVRQVLFELGETYSAMMDIKTSMIKSDPTKMTPVNFRKINDLVDLSINSFRAYLATLNKSDGSLPDKFAPEDTRPALVAYFHLGRLYDRYMIPARGEQKLKNKVQTFCCYKQVVDYCEKYPEAVEVMGDELAICAEFVALLPLKIEKMQRELQRPNE